MKAPLISIVIPCHNEQDIIIDALKSIDVQKFEDLDVVVVFDKCTDNSKKLVEDYQAFQSNMKIVLVDSNKGSAAGARNLGAARASGEYLLFHDSDCFQGPNFLKNLAKHIKENKNIHGIATKTLNTPPKSWLQHAVEVQRKQRWEYYEDKVLELNKASGINVAIIRRDVFNALGGYNEDIFYYEDGEFTKKFFDSGCKAIFAPDVIQYHFDPLTLRESLRQCRSIAKGLRMRIRHGDKLTFWEWVSLFSGIIAPINLITWFAIFVNGYTKTGDTAGSFYLATLWEFRSLAKLYYFCVVKI